MKNVLIVSGANLARGGVQAYLMKWFKTADRSKYRFTWYFPGKILDDEYADEFRSEGIKFIDGNITSLSVPERFRAFEQKLDELMSSEKFDIIHINTGNIKYEYYAVRAGARNKIPRIIPHSHNTLSDSGIKTKIRNKIMRAYIVKNATVCAGCSEMAGGWLFGNRITRSEKWYMVKNTIDSKKFLFDKEIRDEYRAKLGLTDEILIGNVGNMSKQKNQSFLLDVTKKLKDYNINMKLIIFGNGALKDELVNKTKQLRIEDKVIFAGVSDQINNWMQAMDIFVMPSRHEGFAIAAIEAQTAGLPCLFSDKLTRETKLVENVNFLPIDDASVWAAYIQGMISGLNMKDRYISKDVIKDFGFDESCIPQQIEELYG